MVAGDGQVKYVGSAKDMINQNFLFPGFEEGFKTYAASISGTCAFCKNGVEASVKATTPVAPSGTGTDGDPYIWQLYNALGSVTANNASLFSSRNPRRKHW